MTSSSAGGLLRRRCAPSPPHGVASKLFALVSTHSPRIKPQGHPIACTLMLCRKAAA